MSGFELNQAQKGLKAVLSASGVRNQQPMEWIQLVKKLGPTHRSSGNWQHVLDTVAEASPGF